MRRGGVIMGDWKFLKSLYIVGRGMLTHFFVKTSLYSLFSLSQMLSSPPPPTFLSPPTLTSTVLSVVMFL